MPGRTRTGIAIITILPLLACGPQPGSNRHEPVSPPIASDPIPIADSTLSILEATERGCAWKRLDPPAGRETILATFPHGCHGGVVNWSAGGRRATLLFDPEAVDGGTFHMSDIPDPFVRQEAVPAEARLHLYVVDLASGLTTELPPPPRGDVSLLGIADDDRVMALTREFIEPLEDGIGRYVPFEGGSLRIEDRGGGTPILAHAFAWSADDWARTETKVSDSEWDYALGVEALDARRMLGDGSWESLSPRGVGRRVEEGPVLAALSRFAPAVGEEDALWVRLGGSDPPAYVWQISFEFTHPTGLIVLSRGPELIIAPGLDFTAGDLTAPLLRGRFLLVAARGTGTHPRLYDLSTAERVYASDSARAALFWPDGASR